MYTAVPYQLSSSQVHREKSASRFTFEEKASWVDALGKLRNVPSTLLGERPGLPPPFPLSGLADPQRRAETYLARSQKPRSQPCGDLPQGHSPGPRSPLRPAVPRLRRCRPPAARMRSIAPRCPTADRGGSRCGGVPPTRAHAGPRELSQAPLGTLNGAPPRNAFASHLRAPRCQWALGPLFVHPTNPLVSSRSAAGGPSPWPFTVHGGQTAENPSIDSQLLEATSVFDPCRNGVPHTVVQGVPSSAHLVHEDVASGLTPWTADHKLTRSWTVAGFRRMDAINIAAFPMIPLEEDLAVSEDVLKAMKNAIRKDLEDNPPTCIIGSMDQVNQRITEVELTSNPVASLPAIERFEVEKKALREKNRGVLGDRDKDLKPQATPCGEEHKNAKSSMLKRKTANKNLLVELYQYPDFNPSGPNELPNGVDFCDMVGNVIRSEKNPSSGKFFCEKKKVQKFLSSPCQRAILLDSFWWIFHERYQPNKDLQRKLFDRISRNYAHLLFLEPRSYYEEALLKRFPNLLSKGVYTCFCTCFPQSWFNTHEFKTAVCNTISLWLSGIYPCPQSYNAWDSSELDPERFRREELMLQRKKLIKGRAFSGHTHKRFFSQKSGSSKKFNHSVATRSAPVLRTPRRCEQQAPSMAKGQDIVYFFFYSSHSLTNRLTDFCFSPLEFNMSAMAISSKKDPRQPEGSTAIPNTLKEQPYEALMMKRVTSQSKGVRPHEILLHKQSHPACKSPEVVENYFNIYGKSPLIVYFLHNYAILQHHGKDVLVVRREKTRSIPDLTPTYADVIAQARKNIKKRKDNLARLNWLHWNEWNFFDELLKEQQSHYLREVEKINQKAAEQKKINHRCVPPSTFTDEYVDWKVKGSHCRARMSVKVQKEWRRNQPRLSSPFPQPLKP
ncbi:protein FAM227A [Echinops telfairi]|uniref:Protein FAM227A n=1 Tax=Echinops telfairi TaxID=9371 RepID=A0AC55D521_ECHTE|nr:protein FAM227A [Echinops telfairi]